VSPRIHPARDCETIVDTRACSLLTEDPRDALPNPDIVRVVAVVAEIKEGILTGRSRDFPNDDKRPGGGADVRFLVGMDAPCAGALRPRDAVVTD